MARDPDATALLGRFLLGAVGLVIGGALLFALIGAVAGDDGDATAAPTTPAATEDGPEPAATGTEVPTGAPTEAPTDAPTGPAETTTDAPAPTETATDAGQEIDPATVTVQVLDGTGGTGAASEVAGRSSCINCNFSRISRRRRSSSSGSFASTSSDHLGQRQRRERLGDVLGDAGRPTRGSGPRPGPWRSA
jgi:hypothetical protein